RAARSALPRIAGRERDPNPESGECWMTHRWLRACSWGNLALLALLFLVTRAAAERSPITTLLLYLPQLFYAAPLLPLLAWAAARRDRQALLANALGAALVAGPFMGFCLPTRMPWTGKRGPALRVMTFNIHG